MPRYAKIITKKELENKLIDKKNLLTVPYKDLNLEVHLSEDDKVNIDIKENNNLIYALVSAQSNYEILPIYFMVYIDCEDRLRAFLPKHGNTYNPWTATAFGSERAWKTKTKSITDMPEQYYEDNKEQGGYKETQQYKDDFYNLQPNIELMTQEFLKFIHIK